MTLKKKHVRATLSKKRRLSPFARMSSSNKEETSQPSLTTKEKKKRSSNTKKKVRFARSGKRIKIDSCREMSRHEKEALWYTATERQAMKQDARRSAVALQPQYTDAMNKVFRSARYLACISDEQETETLLHDCFVLSKTSKVLYKWFSSSSDDDDDDEAYRGLENMVSASHRYGREELAKDAKSVVAAQYHLATTPTSEEEDEETAREYQEMSRVSVLLARLLGDADAVALEQH